jgi:Phytanoyl-CoA dioxygenase (PhyH)
MVTDQQVDHYRTFGFVVLRGYLDQRETAALSKELDSALRDAFGAHFHQRPRLGGIEGHYLPMMSRHRTPISLALVEDARLLGAARQLFQAPVLPTYAQGILLFGEAGFHYDDGTGSQGVKFVAYLEPLTAQTGALRLMPGSHQPDFAASLRSWQRRNPALDAEGLRRQLGGIPCHVAETRPGDVIAFDWHTYHASIGGTDRRQWTISYAKDPRTTEETKRLQDFFRSTVPDGDEPYDHAAYPCYDEHWLVAGPEHLKRATLAERMRELGLFDIARGR